MKPKAIILSGGPASVHEAGSPRAPQTVFESGVPVLGICYGQMTMAAQLGGKVEGGHHREFGRADVEVKASSSLFEGVWAMGDKHQVWMSHGDRVTAMPPGFQVDRRFAERAVRRDRGREAQILRRDVPPRSGAHAGRRHAAPQFRAQDRRPHAATGRCAPSASEAIEKIRAQVGKGRVICGLVGRRRFLRRRGADP